MQRATEVGAGNFQQSFSTPFREDELVELRTARVTAEARQRQLLLAMTAFRDGDFSVRLPADWDGVDARIAEAFNKGLAHKEQLLREVSRLKRQRG